MPTLVFGEERWSGYFRDAQELWKEHWEEFCPDKGHLPLLVDERKYRALALEGSLHILTARQTERFSLTGRLVGYHLAVLGCHAHHQGVLCAFDDTFFLRASCRKGTNGVKLLSESLAVLKAKGVQQVFLNASLQQDSGRLFEFLGFSPAYQTYVKWLG